MAIDPVKIPANVQVEEKIFGPVSLRQIMLLISTGGVSYVIWTTLQRNGLNTITYTVLAWIPTAIGAAFAFVQINGVSLWRLLFLGMERLQKPSARPFGPREGIAVNIRTSTSAPKKRPVQKKANNEHMEELSELLDTGLEELTETQEVDEEPSEPPKAVDPRKISISPEQTSTNGIDGVTGTPPLSPS